MGSCIRFMSGAIFPWYTLQTMFVRTKILQVQLIDYTNYWIWVQKPPATLPLKELQTGLNYN